MHDCLNCASTAPRTKVLDLGKQPLANGYQLHVGNSTTAPRYPLAISECPVCHLVQLDERAPEDLFRRDYPFRQGESKTWLAHLEEFEEAAYGDQLWRETSGRHLDVGANDGTFVRIMRHGGWDSVGVDPAPTGPFVSEGVMGLDWAYNQADMRGNPTKPYDLITAFNVLAHVLDLDDFLGGIKAVLAPERRLVVEVPNWDLSTWTQVYAEHASYFTESTLVDCLERRGFTVTSVTPQPTHEGSIRVVATHA